MNLVCRAFLYTVCYSFFTVNYLYIALKAASLERYFVSYGNIISVTLLQVYK